MFTKDDAFSGEPPVVVCGTSASPPPERASGSSRALRPVAKGTPRKAKRTSFSCVACGKTFPTQQAMAGHCSIHTRDRKDGGQLLPAGGLVVEPAPSDPSRGRQHRAADAGGHRPGVHGPGGATSFLPAAVVPYPLYLPFVHHLHYPMMSNQVAVRTPAYWLGMHGRNTSPQLVVDVTMVHAVAAFRAAGHHVQAAQVGWGTVFPFRTVLPVPRNTTGAAPPVPSHACSAADQPRCVRVGPTLQLGGSSGGGNGAAQKRTTLLPLLGGGREGKRAVEMDGGDKGAAEGKDMDGFDLELRLCR